MSYMEYSDGLCSSKLFREGCDTTVKLSTNTRLQKEQLLQLSSSFPNSTIILYCVPNQANLAAMLTKVSKKPVKLVNSDKYRKGKFNEGVKYMNLHQTSWKTGTLGSQMESMNTENWKVISLSLVIWKTRIGKADRTRNGCSRNFLKAKEMKMIWEEMKILVLPVYLAQVKWGSVLTYRKI